MFFHRSSVFEPLLFSVHPETPDLKQSVLDLP
jgi:hypothetical protein